MFYTSPQGKHGASWVCSLQAEFPLPKGHVNQIPLFPLIFSDRIVPRTFHSVDQAPNNGLKGEATYLV